MGFQVPKRIFSFKFEGDFEGAEIRTRSISFGEMLDLGDQIDRLQAGAGLAGVRDLVDKFVKSIESWNLEDDGVPVASDIEGFSSLDPDLAMGALKAWAQRITGQLGDDLGKDSTNGRPSAPPNFPMEAP